MRIINPIPSVTAKRGGPRPGSGRPPGVANHATKAAGVLLEIAMDKDAPPEARVHAASRLLDRAERKNSNQ